jgi:hypothetical protein
VSIVGDLERLYAQIRDEKGRLDILFANARRPVGSCHPAWPGQGLIEERHREVAEIEKLRFNLLSLLKLLKNPLRRLL